jgi:hypothetical protein
MLTRSLSDEEVEIPWTRAAQRRAQTNPLFEQADVGVLVPAAGETETQVGAEVPVGAARPPLAEVDGNRSLPPRGRAPEATTSTDAGKTAAKRGRRRRAVQ